MSRSRSALVLLPILAIAGCSGGGTASQEAGLARTEGAVLATAATAAPKSKALAAIRRRVIYQGQVSLDCESLDRAAESLEREVRRVDGYIGDAHRDAARGQIRAASWTIRVPSDRFDAFLKSVRALGEFRGETREAEDVSEEFYDAEARVANKRVEEARLVELLKRVAGNLDQILRVETELSRIRGEIETIEGRLRYLAHMTDLSTVTVAITEVKGFVPEGPPTLSARIARSFGGSVDALAEFGAGLLILLVAAAPWAIPVAMMATVARMIVRRRQHRPAAPPVVVPSE